MQPSFSWNYTTYLNIAFLVLAAVLLVGFVRTGGVGVLRMMKDMPAEPADEHRHHH